MSRVILLFLICLATQQVIAQRECNAFQYASQIANADPSAKQKILAAESFIQSWRSELLSSGIDNPTTAVFPVITIPVVVHILFKDGSQNVPDENVRRQIDALNKGFRLMNADTSRIPSYFRNLAADCRIQFALAKIDPAGRATTGIVRNTTWVTLYGIDDRIKFSSQGGDDAWDADRYLNIWVGSLAGGIVGYSSPIGGPKQKDGVAIRTDAFGATNGGIYGGGKTLVHEVGHWLGLRHIWGDAACGDDQVDDTPKQQTANRGCPSGIKTSCNNGPYGDMYMNFMDMANDDCMLMFTKGQMNRMRSTFAVGGPRYAILSSNGCTGTPITEPVQLPDTKKPVVKFLQLFPNPAQKQLMIRFEEGADCLGRELIILNQFGQLVKKVRIGKESTIVDVSNFQSGMYFIKMDRGNIKFQDKFIKM